MNEEMAWVARAKQGSDEAFTQLVEAFQKRVYNLCYRMLGEPEAAEDAAQETFLRDYQHFNSYDQTRPFETWLLSIAADYCINRHKRVKFSMFFIELEEEGSFQLPDADAPNPESKVLQQEQRGQIQAWLGCLGALDRAAIVLHYIQNYSEAEIALILDLTANSVKSRLHRARQKCQRSDSKWIYATWKGGLPLITFLVHFSPWEKGGDHNFIQVQFNETHL
jgi:RNA polymerase sigma-70 factor (ECF subfamily)